MDENSFPQTGEPSVEEGLPVTKKLYYLAD